MLASIDAISSAQMVYPVCLSAVATVLRFMTLD